MTLASFLAQTQNTLKNAGITSARLDTLVLLEHSLDKDKTWLLANPDFNLSSDQIKNIEPQVMRRAAREPLAYILNSKEFYGRDFYVNPSVLIPRPETEQIIDEAKNIIGEQPGDWSIPDVGTGSGVIAITAALETGARVTASDISPSALKIAKINAKKLDAKVNFTQSNLLKNVRGKFDMILANLPYVDKNWTRSPETNFEPDLALFAPEGGLELIKKLFEQAPSHLNRGGWLLCEADPRQHQKIREIANHAGLSWVKNEGFIFACRFL